MSLASLMTQTIEIISPALTTDSRGNQIKDWNNAISVTTKAWITKKNSTELDDHREGSSSLWICFLSKEESIDRLDRIRYGLLLLEVKGRPHLAMRPDELHHIEVDLSLVEG